MPTTRRQSAGPSTPSTSLSATPKPSSSRSARRSLSHTPSQASHSHSHPHRTADEIMLSEAEQILHPHPHGHHRTQAEILAEETSEILGEDAESLASPALRSGRLRGEPRRSSAGKGELVVEILAPRSASQRRRSGRKSTGKKDEDETADEQEVEVEDENETSALLGHEAESSAGVVEGSEPGGDHDVVTLGELLTDDEEEEEQEESEGDEGDEDREETWAEQEARQAEQDGDFSDDEDREETWAESEARQVEMDEEEDEDEEVEETEETEETEEGAETWAEQEAQQAELDGEYPESESSHTAGVDDVSFASSTTAQPSSAITPTQAVARPVVSESVESDESDDSSEEESDSDVSSSDDTSEADDSEDEDAEDERLEKLLAAANIHARNASAGQAGGNADGASVGMGDEDMLRLDADEDVADTPIPQMTISGLPPPSLHFGMDRSAQAGPSRPPKARAGTKEGGATGALELDNRGYERPLTKREKANQPKKATPSELWSTLPSARADMLPQMKRDYQALALANSMDPKRFMKGGNKAGKVPENFAIGTIIEQPRHLQDTTMTRETKYRPGQLVQDVVQDTGVGEYAKRKFGDLQWKRMENGRGKGWKKRAKW